MKQSSQHATDCSVSFDKNILSAEVVEADVLVFYAERVE